MCRAFIDTWKRQEVIEQQKVELKEFSIRVEQLSERIRGVGQ